MHDAMVTPEHGCAHSEHNCGSWLAIPFFVSYTILTSFVVLMMIVAIIVENFKLSLREDTRHVRTAHTDAFIEAWAVFDPHAHGRLRVAVLPALLRMLRPPLGPDPRAHRHGVIRWAAMYVHIHVHARAYIYMSGTA